MSLSPANSYICDYCHDKDIGIESISGKNYEFIYSHNQNGERHVFHKNCAEKNYDMITCPICGEIFQSDERGVIMNFNKRGIIVVPSICELQQWGFPRQVLIYSAAVVDKLKIDLFKTASEKDYKNQTLA